MHRAAEVLEDFSPVAVFLGAATVTLVYDDEVEEIRVVAVVIGLQYVLRIFFARAAGERLVYGEEDIRIRRYDSSAAPYLVSVYLDAAFFERIEVVHRLAYEDVAVREEKYARSTLAYAVARPP